MRLIELHILQSFPVTCLNRDDVGAPKSAVFGGTTRARISSQCQKRAVRLCAKEIIPAFFGSERSRLIITPLKEAIKACEVDEEKALKGAKLFCDAIATLDEKAKKKEVLKVKTMTFFSSEEIKEIGATIAKILQSDEKKPDDKIKKAANKLKESKVKDAADIALFGRMVASDHSLTVEGASMFSHSLSTHKSDNDIDFWTAVDDRQKEDPTVADEDKAGSGGMGTIEFNSATYYRYAAINLDLLADDDHLSALNLDERKSVVDAFIKAALMAVPGARKNSMNGHTLPAYVLGIVKEKGQPLQLINSFEKAVTGGRDGIVEKSIEQMKAHHEALKKTWNIETTCEVSLPESDINTFCEELKKYVI